MMNFAVQLLYFLLEIAPLHVELNPISIRYEHTNTTYQLWAQSWWRCVLPFSWQCKSSSPLSRTWPQSFLVKTIVEVGDHSGDHLYNLPWWVSPENNSSLVPTVTCNVHLLLPCELAILAVSRTSESRRSSPTTEPSSSLLCIDQGEELSLRLSLIN